MTYRNAKARPLCRYCGKPIPKRTTSLIFGQSTISNSDYWKTIDAKPVTREDAQRHSNLPLVSVRYHDYPSRHVTSASTWDGESYVDEYFCNGDHAKRFAYVMARNGDSTKAYAEAMKAAGGAK
jgi:hypothetical protein